MTADVHTMVPFQGNHDAGFWSECVCGWSSTLFQGAASAVQAWVRHVRKVGGE